MFFPERELKEIFYLSTQGSLLKKALVKINNQKRRNSL